MTNPGRISRSTADAFGRTGASACAASGLGMISTTTTTITGLTVGTG